MEAVFVFLWAALPLISVGLALAVLFARSTGKNKKRDQTGDCGAEGMCLEMCFGTALGAAFGNNIAIGLPLGMLFGLAIGTGIKKEGRDNDEAEESCFHRVFPAGSCNGCRNLFWDRQLRSFLPWTDRAWMCVCHFVHLTVGAGIEESHDIKI